MVSPLLRIILFKGERTRSPVPLPLWLDLVILISLPKWSWMSITKAVANEPYCLLAYINTDPDEIFRIEIARFFTCTRKMDWHEGEFCIIFFEHKLLWS